MLRIIVCLLVGAGIGALLGQMQASFATSGFVERFAGSRIALAESRGEKTRQELIEQSTGTPQIEVVDGTEFRFGTMQHGETMSHDFVFRNTGSGPLNLDMGGSTCKCTVGELESSVLQPGEETTVSLTWTAQTIMPDFGQTATILTNDPDNPEVRLEVRGQIAHSFVVDPPEIALGDISVREAVDRTFHVFTYLKQSTELEDFQWTDLNTRDLVTFTHEKVELDPAKFPQHTNAHAVHEVHLHIEAGLPIGQVNSRITFSTDQGENIGRLEMPVTGRVTGEVVIIGGPSFDTTKNLLTMGTVKSSEGAKVSISLAVQGQKRDDLQPQIVSVKPDKALKVTVGEATEVGNRTFFKVQFEVPKGAPESYYAGNNPKDFGKVVIRTNHENFEEIPIYVRLIVVE